jgi:hypothetical protein
VTPKAGEPRSGARFGAAVEVIGDRWSFLDLREIMFVNRLAAADACRWVSQ